MFHDRSLLGGCIWGFVLPVLEYCSAVWCSAADSYLKILDRAVSGAWFLTGGVFECDIAHHRSVAVLCKKGKVFNRQEPPSGESTTTECKFNYQLLAVIYRSSPMGSSYLQATTTSYGQWRQRR